jgi:hypothetical protein
MPITVLWRYAEKNMEVTDEAAEGREAAARPVSGIKKPHIIKDNTAVIDEFRKIFLISRVRAYIFKV